MVNTQPLDLPNSSVAAALAKGWHLAVDEIEYAAVGFGSHHWRVTSGEAHWFVTVDDLDARHRHATESRADVASRLAAALTVAGILQEAGLGFVVAPIRTRDGLIIERVGHRYVMALYPHIDGETHSWGRYTTDAHRRAVIDQLAVLHGASELVADVAVRDNFTILSRDTLELALADRQARWGPGPFAMRAARLLGQHRHPLAAALVRYDEFVNAVEAEPACVVVTHGEPHRANTIRTDNGVVLIDWDTALLAPPERDLWMLLDEDASLAEVYTDHTGTTINSDALEMYRLWWDLCDIALFIAEFREPHSDTADTRAAWAGLEEHLDPDRWVAR